MHGIGEGGRPEGSRHRIDRLAGEGEAARLGALGSMNASDAYVFPRGSGFDRTISQADHRRADSIHDVFPIFNLAEWPSHGSSRPYSMEGHMANKPNASATRLFVSACADQAGRASREVGEADGQADSSPSQAWQGGREDLHE